MISEKLIEVCSRRKLRLQITEFCEQRSKIKTFCQLQVSTDKIGNVYITLYNCSDLSFSISNTCKTMHEKSGF